MVEDNRSQAMIMERMLQEGGTEFEVVHVGTLGEAKEHLETAKVACILLDLTLPDAARLDGLMELKNVVPEASVVVVTADNDAGRGIKAVQAGAQDYLVKGQMDSAQLCRAVRYAIERGRSEQQLAHRALHDALTGLPNRLLFLDVRGEAALGHHLRDRHGCIGSDLRPEFAAFTDGVGDRD